MIKQALRAIKYPVFLRDHWQSKSTYDLIYGDEPCKLHKVGGIKEEILGRPGTSFWMSKQIGYMLINVFGWGFGGRGHVV